MAKDKEKKKKDKKAEAKVRKPRKLKKSEKKKALKKEEKKAKKKKKEKKAGKKEKASKKKKKDGKKKEKGGKKKNKKSDGLAGAEEAPVIATKDANPEPEGSGLVAATATETTEMAIEGPEVFLPFHPEEDPEDEPGPIPDGLQSLADEVIAEAPEAAEIKPQHPPVITDSFGIPPIPPMEDMAENKEVGEDEEE